MVRGQAGDFVGTGVSSTREGDVHPAVIWVLGAAFWWWMVTDCLRNESLKGIHRMGWLAALVCLPVLGSLLYFLLAKGGRGSRPLI